jgi:hypothetical protein
MFYRPDQFKHLPKLVMSNRLLQDDEFKSKAPRKTQTKSKLSLTAMTKN